MSRPGFSPAIAAFGQAIAGDEAPGGPPLRYQPVYLQIRQAREADDASLPMGEWDRPLKTANWPLAETLCTRVLMDESKDFQVAFWLTEAWLHRHGTAGLRAGIELVGLLARDFWDSAHPLIEDGDGDARAAPFAWASEALAHTLRTQLPLLSLPDHEPSVGNLDLWERTLGGVPGQAKPGDKNKPTVVDPDKLRKAGRAEMLAHGTPAEIARLAAMVEDLEQLTVDWQALDGLLTRQLGNDAPSLARLANTLASLRRAVLALIEGRDPRAAEPEHEPAPETVAAVAEPEPLPLPGEPATMSTAEPPAPLPAAASAVPAVIASRDDAYRMLELAAAYLERNEPHSPTPYLVKRAVTWGRMSLSDLMQEILREEGDLARYFSLLGIQTRAD